MRLKKPKRIKMNKSGVDFYRRQQQKRIREASVSIDNVVYSLDNTVYGSENVIYTN